MAKKRRKGLPWGSPIPAGEMLRWGMEKDFSEAVEGVLLDSTGECEDGCASPSMFPKSEAEVTPSRSIRARRATKTTSIPSFGSRWSITSTVPSLSATPPMGTPAEASGTTPSPTLSFLMSTAGTNTSKSILMDAEGPDVVWPVEGGKALKTNAVGQNILNYDSMLVLAHFKGHPMSGCGGALKQLSIGCASRAGKALIHSAGASGDRYECREKHASHILFPEAMADTLCSFPGSIAPEITTRTVLHGPPRRGPF